MQQREETEAPSSPQAPNLQASSQAPWFRVGRDRHGNWVVQDPRGIRGGLFINCDQALRFVRAENGNRPGEFVMVGGILELDMSKVSVTTQCQGEAGRRVA